MSCLDVPVPGCIRGLVPEASAPHAESGDDETFRRLRGYCETYQFSAGEMDHARSLASGPSDLIVLVERPRGDLRYRLDFANFVRACPTLKAVDELIRFASKGARSIETVTVLQVFSYPGNLLGHLSTSQAYRLVGDIIRLKKPKVVLCCWTGRFIEEESTFADRFMSRGVGTWPPYEHVGVRDLDIITIRSFPPAITLRLRRTSPHTRMLLVYHFVLAFRLLEDPAASSGHVSDWAKLMSERGSEAQGVDASDLSREGVVLVTDCIPETLIEELSLNPKSSSLRGISSWQPAHQIAFFLKELCHSDYSGGAAPLVQLCLVLQFYEHPEKEEIIKGLHEAGCRQKTFEVEPDVRLRTIPEAARLLDDRLTSILEAEEDFVDVQAELEDMVIVE